VCEASLRQPCGAAVLGAKHGGRSEAQRRQVQTHTHTHIHTHTHTHTHSHTHRHIPFPSFDSLCSLLPAFSLSSILYSSLFCLVPSCLVSFLPVQWLLTSSCHSVHIPLHSILIYLTRLNSTQCHMIMITTHSPLLFPHLILSPPFYNDTALICLT
jgi:hypothetical protein